VQTATGKLTEAKVLQRIEGLGLCAQKPVPDRGVDIIAWHPDDPKKIVRIQVKGRNPQKVKSFRWFQIRVSKNKLERARNYGIPADQTWSAEVLKVDFFVLVAAKINEMWVLSQEQVVDLIRCNGQKYATRPDNVFVYDDPIKAKQKEMNLDIEVHGMALTARFRDCLNNFDPILMFLRSGQ
jgi:hypothetical protein